LVAAPVVRQLGDDAERQAVPAEAPAPDPEPEPEPRMTEPEPEFEFDADDVAEPTPLFPTPPRQRRHAKPAGAPRNGSIIARGLSLMEEAAKESGDPLTTNELVRALGCTPRHAQNIVKRWNAS
ncbi:hypothetical protein G3I26_05730, partial [Streptomyces sp. SID7909]|nr:hypothetical protein [Streptomyces sp. SID7909]